MDNTGLTTGFTESERYLHTLAKGTFLSLWSYPNLFRDQGNARGGDGKEICDLLVVCGDDLIIFSDKHIELRDAPSTEVGWGRWVRSAVMDGARQLFGAERWIKKEPHRLFVDKCCATQLPIALPLLDRARVHRIVIVRGAAERCRELLGGSGSLMVTNQPLDEKDLFTVGQPFPGKGFVHVIDETALDALLGQLDTVTDFVSYLTQKESFMTSERIVLAAGEEELLAAYLRTLDPAGGHDFPKPEGSRAVFLDEGLWEEFLASDQHRAQVSANEISYCWDALAEKFNHHILSGTQHYSTASSVRESEQLMRWMAREPRVRRRMLAGKLIEMIDSTRANMKRATVIPPSNSGDPYWVFLVFPEPRFASYEEYREVRFELLTRYCWVVKHLFPGALDIVGIATNAGGDGRMTEDAGYLDAREWNSEIAEEARRLHEDHGLLRTVARHETKAYEFPIFDKNQ